MKQLIKDFEAIERIDEMKSSGSQSNLATQEGQRGMKLTSLHQKASF